jgi:hypothetical protein
MTYTAIAHIANSEKGKKQLLGGWNLNGRWPKIARK